MKKIFLSLLISFVMLGIVNSQQKDTISIFFDLNKWDVNANNAHQLDMLMQNYDVDSIWIYGYTDFLGNTEYNQQLSEKRSLNVHNYLLLKGIVSEKIIKSKGFGVYPNSSAATHQDPSEKGNKSHRMAQVVYTYSHKKSKRQNPLLKETLFPNSILVMENLLFYDNLASIYTLSYPVLEDFYELMQVRSTLKIEIHGHVCCSNDSVHAASLSRNRARAVYDYLFVNGIDSARMKYKGFGATRKKYPLELNEYERFMNRRVEILILEI